MGSKSEMQLRAIRWVWLSLSLGILCLTCLVILLQVRISSAADTSWHSVGPYGGRVYALAVDSTDSSVVYAGTDNGVFKTADSGLSWQQLGFPDKQIVSISIDYVALPKTVYAAGAWGVIYRSSNDGETWEDISAGASSEYIRVMASDPAQSERLWLGTNGGAYKWNSGNSQWEPTAPISSTRALDIRGGVVFAGTEYGVFKTTNDGVSWESINGDLPQGYQERCISSLVLDPNDSQVIYIGTWYGGAYKTVDGGQHWYSMNTGLPSFTEITALAFNPTNSNVLYAASYGFFASSVDDSGVFKSTNGGGSWSHVSAGITNRYARSLDVHPTVGDIVYVGTLGGGVFRTANGGDSWEHRVQGLNALEVNAFLETGGTLYAATEFDGVYRSTDEGQSWESFNNGLPPTTLFAYDLAEDEQNNVFLGIGQWGVLRLDSGSWVTVTNTLTRTDVSAIVDVSGTLMIAAAEPGQSNNQILVSTDTGSTWTEQNEGLPSPLQVRSLSVQRSGDSVTIFAATSQGIYKTSFSPISWSESNSGLSTDEVYDVAVDPNNPDVLHAATRSYVYKSENSGVSWEKYQNGLDSSCLRAVVVDPTDSNRVYVGGDNGVYQSNDAGSFWSQVGADSFSYNRVEALTVLSDQTLLAGTSGGGWRTGASEPVPTPTPEPQVSWTVLAYLNGDNDLDRYVFDAFNNLELAAYNPNIKVVALWDQRGPLGGDTREYLVQPDSDPYSISSSYVLNENYWNRGELDMGDPATLVNFVNNARAYYPAEHYFLTIVDHGGGWSAKVVPDLARTRWFLGGSGLSWDETNDSHYLATYDMRRIFDQIVSEGGRVDVVFYDACLMGMFEEVYQIRDGADYLVASENQAWAVFPYDTYLQDIGSGTTAKELAIQVVDRYHNSLSAYPHTMSAVDLSRASEVKVALNDLASALINSLPDAHSAISNTFAAAQKFDYDNDLSISGKEGYVDLVDFAENLVSNLPGTAVESAAQSLLDTINDPAHPLIVRERHESNIAWFSGEYLDLDGANGISIYLPLGETDTELSYYIASQLDLAADTLWDDFIFDYVDQFPPQSGGRGSGRGDNPVPLPLNRYIYLPLVMRNTN